MPFFEHNDLCLHYKEIGRGVPFFFQHGLGADVEQPFQLFRPPEGIRLIALDCRSHGQSSVGRRDQIRLGTFADDLLALMQRLGISSAIVGGISMGAAVALNFALRYAGNALGLVLSRPAWLDAPNPFNVRIFSLIAELIDRFGPGKGLETFKASAEFADIQARYPDTAKSLEGQFLQARAQENCVNLKQIPTDRPSATRAEWGAIVVPTLILANRQDPMHPYEYGQTLAAGIKGAELREIASKSIDPARHQREVQAYLEQFLIGHFLNGKASLC